MNDKIRPHLMEPLWLMYQIEGYGHALPAGPQHTECKRAFFAGAYRSLMALMALASDGPNPTQSDTDLMDQIMEEINAFFQAESITHNAQKH